MVNYKESTITGQMKTWRRCKNIVIDNSYNKVPKIMFAEEDIIILPDGTKTKGNKPTGFQQLFDKPESEFDLIHPKTGEVIGKAKHKDVYVMLYSLYIDLAKKRDGNG